jgi:two-component system sensor histidine kinase RpfC
MQIIVGFLVYSVVLFLSTLIWSQHAVYHRIVGICVDIGVFSYGLHVTGPLSAPWYGVYLWVTLGNGFRYGEKYLYLSGAASLVGFGGVVATTPYWVTHTELAIGLAVTLLVIPAYSATLIRRLNEARQRADAASRAKSEFLSRMSHEIRTPLNGILGMTDLLRTRPLDPEDREYVETIHASGKKLAHQIDEILDLSKIEAGQLLLEELEFDLYALINTTLRIFEPQVKAKQIQLQETINPNTPFMLCGDPHKLRQIIINLVGNAIKFTDQGFVSLRVYPREQVGQKVTLRFEVADTGSGISAECLEQIFEPFAQADSSVARSYGGTGLGTTICKHLVELMGGEIGVQSYPDVGTTFWFDISFETSRPQERDADQPWTTECNVFYLPGEHRWDTSVPIMLRDWNIPFKTIETLTDAMQLFQSDTIDIRSIDALIIDGVPYSEEMESLLSQLDSAQPYNALPIVLTGSEQYPPQVFVRQNDHLFALGAPVDRRVLFNTLHACYTRHSTEDDVIHIAHQQAAGVEAPKQLNVLIGDDNATNRLVLERMLKKMGHQCTAVTGGEEVLIALELGHYDVAIVDKNMPDMNGIEVFNAYSMAHGGEPPAKFVILTADATAESRDACVAAGIEYFLTKPVSLARLQATLNDAMGSVDAAEEKVRREAESGQTRDFGELAVVDE